MTPLKWTKVFFFFSNKLLCVPADFGTMKSGGPQKNCRIQNSPEFLLSVTAGRMQRLGCLCCSWYVLKVIMKSCMIYSGCSVDWITAYVLKEVIKILQPLLLGQIILYFESYNPNDRTSLYMVCGYAALMSVSTFGLTILQHLYYYNVQTIGMKIRVAMCHMIYRKVSKGFSTKIFCTFLKKKEIFR